MGEVKAASIHRPRAFIVTLNATVVDGFDSSIPIRAKKLFTAKAKADARARNSESIR